MQDIKNTLDFVQSLAPAARIATANGTGVDTVNYNASAVIFEAGVVTDGTHTPTVTESDDNVTFTAVAAGDLIGTLANMASNTVQKVGYMGRKRYIRANYTVAGATTGAVTSALVIGGNARRQPL
jgi:hypothetical protein